MLKQFSTCWRKHDFKSLFLVPLNIPVSYHYVELFNSVPVSFYLDRILNIISCVSSLRGGSSTPIWGWGRGLHSIGVTRVFWRQGAEAMKCTHPESFTWISCWQSRLLCLIVLSLLCYAIQPHIHIYLLLRQSSTYYDTIDAYKGKSTVNYTQYAKTTLHFTAAWG